MTSFLDHFLTQNVRLLASKWAQKWSKNDPKNDPFWGPKTPLLGPYFDPFLAKKGPYDGKNGQKGGQKLTQKMTILAKNGQKWSFLGSIFGPGLAQKYAKNQGFWAKRGPRRAQNTSFLDSFLDPKSLVITPNGEIRCSKIGKKCPFLGVFWTLFLTPFWPFWPNRPEIHALVACPNQSKNESKNDPKKPVPKMDPFFDPF